MRGLQRPESAGLCDGSRCGIWGIQSPPAGAFTSGADRRLILLSLKRLVVDSNHVREVDLLQEVPKVSSVLGHLFVHG